MTRRNSLRYPGYDYAEPGTVFVTLCLQYRQALLGAIENGQFVPSEAGVMVAECLQAVSARFHGVHLDSWVVMSDHLHAIVHVGTDPERERASPSVGEVVRWFKASTVEAYRHGVANAAWPPYDRRLWQSSFHDRIVRTPQELDAIRTYIAANPARWWERMKADENGSAAPS